MVFDYRLNWIEERVVTAAFMTEYLMGLRIAKMKNHIFLLPPKQKDGTNLSVLRCLGAFCKKSQGHGPHWTTGTIKLFGAY